MQILSMLVCLIVNSSIYSLQFQDIDGTTVSMNQYQGKKILLVNIATGSSRVDQLAGLQQLHQQYGDSVVIIGFPSNSFGHESRSNEEIKQFCQTNYGVTFLIASKNPVTGTGIQSIYNWLTDIGENEMMGDPVGRDFQKYLISSSGQLIGLFGPSVEPMSSELTNQIINQ